MNKGAITVVAIIALAIVAAAIILGVSMNNDKQATLVPYTGVGSGVFKHGTIVKVVDGEPVVIGHFDDDSGKTFPGTWEVKQ